jgi:hypothetical protein
MANQVAVHEKGFTALCEAPHPAIENVCSDCCLERMLLWPPRPQKSTKMVRVGNHTRVAFIMQHHDENLESRVEKSSGTIDNKLENSSITPTRNFDGGLMAHGKCK